MDILYTYTPAIRPSCCIRFISATSKRLNQTRAYIVKTKKKKKPKTRMDDNEF